MLQNKVFKAKALANFKFTRAFSGLDGIFTGLFMLKNQA
jgi:hypothetical protein